MSTKKGHTYLMEIAVSQNLISFSFTTFLSDFYRVNSCNRICYQANVCNIVDIELIIVVRQNTIQRVSQEFLKFFKMGEILYNMYKHVNELFFMTYQTSMRKNFCESN